MSLLLGAPTLCLVCRCLIFLAQKGLKERNDVQTMLQDTTAQHTTAERILERLSDLGLGSNRVGTLLCAHNTYIIFCELPLFPGVSYPIRPEFSHELSCECMLCLSTLGRRKHVGHRRGSGAFSGGYLIGIALVVLVIVLLILLIID